jgi:hypothetical protein
MLDETIGDSGQPARHRSLDEGVCMSGYKIAAIALGIGLCSCGEDDPFAREKLAVRAALKDPDSAQFKDVRRCGSGVMVQGSVNAKNGFGGYTGFTDFYTDGEKASLGEAGDVEAYIALVNRCTAEIRASMTKKPTQ